MSVAVVLPTRKRRLALDLSPSGVITLDIVPTTGKVEQQPDGEEKDGDKMCTAATTIALERLPLFKRQKTDFQLLITKLQAVKCAKRVTWQLQEQQQQQQQHEHDIACSPIDGDGEVCCDSLSSSSAAAASNSPKVLSPPSNTGRLLVVGITHSSTSLPSPVTFSIPSPVMSSCMSTPSVTLLRAPPCSPDTLTSPPGHSDKRKYPSTPPVFSLEPAAAVAAAPTVATFAASAVTHVENLLERC